METTGLRERNKSRTRQDLAAAALDLFSKNGFQATTVEEIAAAAEVSPRTFFRYFPTKEAVLFGQDPEREAAFTEFVKSRPAGESAFDKLRTALLGYVDGFEQNRDQHLLRAQLVRQTPSLHAADRSHESAWEETVTAALIASDPTADEHEIRLVTAATFAAVRVTTQRWLDDGGDANLPTLVLDAISKLGRGLDRSR